MPSHPEFIAAFGQAIAAGGLPPGVTATAPEEAERRFAVYRNNVAHSLAEALKARFPVVERLVGAEFFAAMAGVYWKDSPPSSPILFQWGETFPDFLAAFPPLAGLPYLPDVARLELARGRAYHAADAAPAPPEAVAAAAAGADRARLTLHPSVQRLVAPWAFVTIWQANQPGGAAPGKIDADRTEAALVLRDRQDLVQVERLGLGDDTFLASLMAGHPLLVAAEAGSRAEPQHDAGPFLMRLIRHGAITQITFGETP
ncbi:HvfC/BufC N-terminal domain-containing protein [Gemmobacter lutimaris]|uniref:HvfC/BufC N-terminal domain-containing protein n=1 Tax=Gemmobacter lutimaris TaxID=2306023 RepID=UPI0013147435|nr:DNA-binding domain-containing protein [Gemmobacter lutimaris]